MAESAGVKPTTVAKHFPTKADLFAGLYEEFHTAAFTPPENGPGADALPFWFGLPGRFDKVAKAYRDVVGLVLEGLADARAVHQITMLGVRTSARNSGRFERGSAPVQAGRREPHMTSNVLTVTTTNARVA